MMKRRVSIALAAVLAFALAASCVRAEENPRPKPGVRSILDSLFKGKKDGPSPQPEDTPSPTLDAELLFGDLFKNRENGADDASPQTEPPEPTPSPQPQLTPAPEPEPDAYKSGALFGEEVRQITSDPWGGKVDFAYVGGWVVSRGYFEDRYALTGIDPSGTDRVTLADNDPVSFVPAWDAIVYYGEGTKGEYGWLELVPGEKRPYKLPLKAADEVFYSDGESIWYYSPGKDNATIIGRMGLDGLDKKKLGSVKGQVVTMMPGQEVLLVNFSKNRVQLWRNGEYKTIYDPKEDIVSVISGGRGVWIEHEDGYGPLADGQVLFRLPGHVVATAGSTDQMAFLVLPFQEAEFFDVYMFNEVQRAYAWVGRVKRSDSTVIELQQSQMIVWGPEESLMFEYPIPELWLPYGYYDYASAENLLSDEAWMQLLVGSWCAEPWVGSGYAERLVFTRDDLYRLPAQSGASKAKAQTSLWHVSDGILLKYADRDVPKKLRLSGPFSVPEEQGPYSPMIRIDGVPYYQYSPDPAYFDDLKAYGIKITPSEGSFQAEGG